MGGIEPPTSTLSRALYLELHRPIFISRLLRCKIIVAYLSRFLLILLLRPPYRWAFPPNCRHKQGGFILSRTQPTVSLIIASASSARLDRYATEFPVRQGSLLRLVSDKVGELGIEPGEASKEEYFAQFLCGFLYRKSFLPDEAPFGAGPLLALGIAHS